MKTETAPANASRDRPARASGLSASTWSERLSTKLWSASTRWLRKAASTSEPPLNDLRRFHILFPFLVFVCSPYTEVRAKTLRSSGRNGATLSFRLLPVARGRLSGGRQLA